MPIRNAGQEAPVDSQHVNGCKRVIFADRQKATPMAKPIGAAPAAMANDENISGPGFEHEIERRLRGTPKMAEPALRDHLFQSRLACLCAEAGADFL
jgi:hypothetical protein